MMISDPFPASDFDAWAAGYDQDAFSNSGFPFERYTEVLQTVLHLAQPFPGHSVLDLGCGTGNLTLLFADRGCQVTGTDFSSEMLTLARRKLPSAAFLQADIRGPWSAELPASFGRIVSAYAFHHFDQSHKVQIIADLAITHLNPDGCLVIADIAFPSLAAEEAVRSVLGNDWAQEFYWIADQDTRALQAAGLQVTYQPVTPYAGVFRIQP